MVMFMYVYLGPEFDVLFICVALAAIVFVVIALFERNLAPHGGGRARKLAIFSNWMLFPWSSSPDHPAYPRSVHLPQALSHSGLHAIDREPRRANRTVLRCSRVRAVLGLVIFRPARVLQAVHLRHSPPTLCSPPPAHARPWRPRQVLARRAQGRRGLSQWRQALSCLIVAVRGRRAVCSLQRRSSWRACSLCPNFTTRVAVSSVSGGGLGAAVFAGLTRSLTTNDDAKACLD